MESKLVRDLELSQDQVNSLTNLMTSMGIVPGVVKFCSDNNVEDKMNDIFDIVTGEQGYTDSVRATVMSKLFEQSLALRPMNNAERQEAEGIGPDGLIDDNYIFRVDGRKGDTICYDPVMGHLELALDDGGTIVFNGPKLRGSVKSLPDSIATITKMVIDSNKPATMSRLRTVARTFSLTVSEIS